MTAAPLVSAAVRAAPGADADDWLACPSCHHLVYRPRLHRDLMVCPECRHHHRLSADERLTQLLDPGTFRAAQPQITGTDPLGFVDRKPYPERLAQARERTGLTDAARYGDGEIGGTPVVALAMDFAFLGGSMGSAVGEAVARAAERSLSRRVPLVLAVASGGARMQEGALSLMQMAKTAQALRRLQRGGVGSICVLTDPTFGGVTASFATLADVLVAEHGSLIGFAGPRVIATTTRDRLPDGFQSARDFAARGMLDLVESRDGLRNLLARLVALLGGDQPAPPAAPDEDLVAPVTVRDPDALTESVHPAETLRRARDIARPTTLDYVSRLCADFVELHGDRAAAEDPAIVGGPALFGGMPVMVIGHQKGHDTKELVARNFGMPQPAGYRKALRLMRLAERLRMPVLTFVDTQGAAPGVEAEQRGQAWAIAECIAGMGELDVPVVATILGEGGSGGAIALAAADEVIMMEHSCYSVISPESCSTILFGTPGRAADMAAALRITPAELLRLGVVDAVVREPRGGAAAAPAVAAERLGIALRDALSRLTALPCAELRRRRHQKFRTMGVTVDA